MPGSSEPDQPCQWCHGAAGIGLARLGGLDVMDNPEVRAEIEVALRTTEAYEFGVTDHLCCGNFGRLETLFLAGLSLRRSELIDLALDRANQVVVRREQGSGYRWAAGTDAHNPGFFTGVSGVGYELLRLCYPDILPSILLWEPPVSTTKILTTASGSAGAA